MSNYKDDELKTLLEAAQFKDELVDVPFDRFLREHGYSEDDLSQRVLTDELFMFYSCWYYIKFKTLPHSKKYPQGSKVFRKHRIRQRKNGKLAWGLKCGEEFKNNVKRFQERKDVWLKKLNAIRAAKRSHEARKVNRKEEKQLEIVLATLGLTDVSSAK